MENLVGHDVGRYHLVEQLGVGGMAMVYKAYDTRLERDVAVKFIRRDVFSPLVVESMLKRFEREAKALARLSHPNIVNVFDYGEHEGSPYLVMAYIPGGTLKQCMGQPTDYAAAARLLAPVAHALEYAHQRKVVHRDVKPANILISESGLPMLSDFGIAKIIESGEATLTGTGVGIGTPEYMSPEQGLGRETDHHADIYSLGAVFYELVTGRKPFQADTPMAVLLKHVSDPLPRPADLVPGLPDEVEKVIFKAMAKQPIDRFQSMQELAQAFERLAAGALTREAPAYAAGPLPAPAPVPTSAGPEPARIPPATRTEVQATITRDHTAHLPPPPPPAVRSPAPLAPAARSGLSLTPVLLTACLLGVLLLAAGGIYLGVNGLPISRPVPSAPSAIPPAATAAPAATKAPATAAPAATAAPTRVPAATQAPSLACLVADLPGIGDKSFNALAWKGLEDVRNTSSILLTQYRESKEAADYSKNAKTFMDLKCSIILMVGSAMADDTYRLASDNPRQPFAIVDAAYDGKDLLPNLRGSHFNVSEASFMAGYMAAGMTKKGMVGVYGGMNIPPVVEFMDGYALGVKEYNRVHGTKVLVLGWEPQDPKGGLFINNFVEPGAGFNITTDLLAKGADIIFPVAGGAAYGSLDAVQKSGSGLVIGVDVDWTVTRPQDAGWVLASVLKRVDLFTADTVRLIMGGNFKGGTYTGTVQNGGVELAPSRSFLDRAPDSLKRELDQIQVDIINKKITTRVN